MATEIAQPAQLDTTYINDRFCPALNAGKFSRSTDCVPPQFGQRAVGAAGHTWQVDHQARVSSTLFAGTADTSSRTFVQESQHGQRRDARASTDYFG